MRAHKDLHFFIHAACNGVVIRFQQIVHRRAHQYRQTMRFTVIDREQRHHARTAHFHQPPYRRQRRFVGCKEIDKLTMLRPVILVRQIVAPVALTYRLNKRFDAIVTRVQATAKAATYGIPHVVEHLVALVVEHCSHLLALRGHDHGRDINAPAVRN